MFSQNIGSEKQLKHILTLSGSFSPGEEPSATSLRQGLYLYSNDISLTKEYLSEFDIAVRRLHYQRNNLLGAVFQTPQLKENIGIVIGNGNILSLLPDIPVEHIILIDIEPIVLYFVLALRDIILNSDEIENFEILKAKQLKQIISLEDKLRTKYRKSIISLTQHPYIISEMQLLKDKHFLSSLQRFKNCKHALQKKQIIPLNIDIYNESKTKELGLAIKKDNCQVNFINLSNVMDLDNSLITIQCLRSLPWAQNSQIIATAFHDIGFWHSGITVASDVNELEKKCKQMYHRYDSENRLSS